ncbi:MAG: hypothetical protein H6Q17_521 [Bacteroidetes bacterium]|nr:hypothetical protein [Bacteroidota bacterium]
MEKNVLFFCIGLLCVCFLTQCKKDNTLTDITLYNQPTSVIKQYIKGKWILHYDIGGINGKTRHNYVNSYMEFRFGSIDSIIKNINSTIEIKSPINWFKAQDIFTNSSIYLMGYSLYKTGASSSYRVSEIKNDTLIIAEPVADGYGYMLTRY